MDRDPGLDDTTRRYAVRLFGAPAPIKIREVCSCFGGEILWFDLAGQPNCHLDLFQVRGTVGACLEMGLEPAPISTRQAPSR